MNNSTFFSLEEGLSEAQKNIITERYLLRDKTTREVKETIDEFYHRVSTAVAQAEPVESDKEFYAEEFLKLIAPDRHGHSKFMPNTPCLLNAGTSTPQLSACFYQSVGDSIPEIMDAAKNAALVFQTGGGMGYDLSNIRQENSIVSKSGGIASGPNSFADIYDVVCGRLKSGGKRKGAQQATLRIDHPDIEQFIVAKSDNGRQRWTNFNISVLVTDSFLNAADFGLVWGLRDVRTGNVVKLVDARQLWNDIVYNAWLTGEPGVVFEDEMQRNNPLPEMGRLGQNPCFEATLYNMDACMLGSINLSHGKFIRKRLDGKNPSFDFVTFRDAIRLAVRFLDDCLDINKYPVEAMLNITRNIRRIGIGIMGWADLLLKLGIKYDSEKALQLAAEIGSTFERFSNEASEMLALEKGAFPLFFQCRLQKPDIYKKPRRNITIRSIAPTGTIALISGCSYGIEPIYAFSLVRTNTIETEGRTVYHPMAESYLKSGEELPKYFVGAMQVSPAWHVKMLAKWQSYIDQAVSKTVNLPSEATVEDVNTIYKLAKELRVKCIAIFRDGSRPDQVLRQVIICPTCNTAENIVNADGCTTCVDCGWSKCAI